MLLTMGMSECGKYYSGGEISTPTGQITTAQYPSCTPLEKDMRGGENTPRAGRGQHHPPDNYGKTPFLCAAEGVHEGGTKMLLIREEVDPSKAIIIGKHCSC